MRAYSYQERVDKFGKFDFIPSPVPHNPEHITIRGNWVLANIADIEVPELKTKFHIAKINVHHMAVDAMLDVWKAWNKAGMMSLVHTFDGAWAPRMKRGHAGSTDPHDLSNHAWGTAFDIDAKKYPLGTPAADDAPIHQLVRIAEDCGWYWGGNFHERPDPMHFELGNPLTVMQTLDIQTVLRAHGSLITADGSLGSKTIAEWVSVCSRLHLNPTINRVPSVHEAEVNSKSYAALKFGVP